jgi:hypothetical protein
MEFFPWRRFDTCVGRYDGDRKVKSFSCSDHWRVMAFAQLTYRESLRDIETCLHAVPAKLYHMGLRDGVSRNNLSHANGQRDWRIDLPVHNPFTNYGARAQNCNGLRAERLRSSRTVRWVGGARAQPFPDFQKRRSTGCALARKKRGRAGRIVDRN